MSRPATGVAQPRYPHYALETIGAKESP